MKTTKNYTIDVEIWNRFRDLTSETSSGFIQRKMQEEIDRLTLTRKKIKCQECGTTNVLSVLLNHMDGKCQDCKHVILEPKEI